jgi:DNA replication protein DnaD
MVATNNFTGKDNMNIPVNINTNDLIASVSREEAIDLIVDLDKKFAEVKFTLEIIEKLVKSLKSDMTEEELKKDIATFISPPSPKYKQCDRCFQEVNIETNEGHANYCEQVWGRRGWRQLGTYDG